MNKRHSRVKTAISFAVSLGLIGLTVWLVMNRQYVVDQINVWNYHPTDSIMKIVSRSGLDGKGTFSFYASHPEVDSAADFNNNCQRREAKSAILGCYNNKNIYVYSVTNTKLDGIEEVTAVHEMLHAVWDRMSDSEKSTVSALLEAQYQSMNNQALKDRIAYYDRTEPGERDNELHSILGSEVASLSLELEKYYSQYFSDRSKVTSLYESYNSVFTSLANESDTLYATLGTLSTQIDTLKATYQAAASTLSNDIATFNQKASGGGFSSQSQFDYERSVLLSRSNTLDAQRIFINAKIKTYNDDRTKYQALVVQTEILNKSIDSTVAPAPSL